MYTSTLTTEPDTDTKRCSHCHAPEGNSHPIGNFTVELNTVQIDGQALMLCSYCESGLRSGRSDSRPSTVVLS